MVTLSKCFIGPQLLAAVLAVVEVVAAVMAVAMAAAVVVVVAVAGVVEGVVVKFDAIANTILDFGFCPVGVWGRDDFGF
jgi:hypothetical protein